MSTDLQLLGGLQVFTDLLLVVCELLLQLRYLGDTFLQVL